MKRTWRWKQTSRRTGRCYSGVHNLHEKYSACSFSRTRCLQYCKSSPTAVANCHRNLFRNTGGLVLSSQAVPQARRTKLATRIASSKRKKSVCGRLHASAAMRLVDFSKYRRTESRLGTGRKPRAPNRKADKSGHRNIRKLSKKKSEASPKLSFFFLPEGKITCDHCVKQSHETSKVLRGPRTEKKNETSVHPLLCVSTYHECLGVLGRHFPPGLHNLRLLHRYLIDDFHAPLLCVCRLLSTLF